MVLTKQQVVQWKHDPVTKQVIKWVEEQREMLKEHVISGGASAESTDGTAQLVAKCIGKAEMAQELTEYLLEDLIDMAFEEEEGED